MHNSPYQPEANRNCTEATSMSPSRNNCTVLCEKNKYPKQAQSRCDYNNTAPSRARPKQRQQSLRHVLDTEVVRLHHQVHILNVHGSFSYSSVVDLCKGMRTSICLTTLRRTTAVNTAATHIRLCNLSRT